MGKSRVNRGRARREVLREEADERASARASRSNAGQIALLDSRLGLGVGAVRERNRLGGKEVVDVEKKKKKSGRKSDTRAARKKAKADRHRQRREIDTGKVDA